MLHHHPARRLRSACDRCGPQEGGTHLLCSGRPRRRLSAARTGRAAPRRATRGEDPNTGLQAGSKEITPNLCVASLLAFGTPESYFSIHTNFLKLKGVDESNICERLYVRDPGIRNSLCSPRVIAMLPTNAIRKDLFFLLPLRPPLHFLTSRPASLIHRPRPVNTNDVFKYNSALYHTFPLGTPRRRCAAIPRGCAIGSVRKLLVYLRLLCKSTLTKGK